MRRYDESTTAMSDSFKSRLITHNATHGTDLPRPAMNTGSAWLCSSASALCHGWCRLKVEKSSQSMIVHHGTSKGQRN